MNKEQPILTIAVPTYNGQKTIGFMLDILLPQFRDDIEIIICDNCSTDRTPEIIEEYKKNYPFIKIYYNEKNEGADSNFLKCMLKASGRFVMLISDDDIIIEGAVEKIVDFLYMNPNISMAYLESVAFKDKYTGIDDCHEYKFLKSVQRSFTTSDKAVFFDYCKRLFGFTSSYVWSTDRIHRITEPEKYFNTYFLQAYICLYCSEQPDDVLGLIHGPCIAVGEYGVIGNYDVALVEGIFYQKMMNKAIDIGYPKRAFKKWYSWKLSMLCRNAIIKERAVKTKRTSIRNILKASWNYPSVWIKLYPFLFFPGFICRFVLKIVRKYQGRKFVSYVNRPTD